MRNKTRKVFWKLLTMLPFALLLSFIITGVSDSGIAIFIGIILTGLLIFVNVFDYDKYDELEMSDYLESKHEITFDFEPAAWARIQNIFSSQLDINAKLTDSDEERMKVSLNSNILRPEVTAERISDKIRLSIQYRYLKFIPDNARNYQTIKRLEKKIKTIPPTSNTKRYEY